MQKSMVSSMRRREVNLQIILRKEKYSLSCLIQWEIYTIEASAESREDRFFDGLKINQPSSLIQA
jgi:hypothetical protein